MKTKLYFHLLLSLLFVSCSHTINIKAPVHKFLTAESQGETLKGKVSTYFINGTEATVELTNDNTENPLEVNNGDIDSQWLGLTGGVGVHGPVDLVYVSGGSLGTSIYGIKTQVLETREVKEKYINFPFL